MLPLLYLDPSISPSIDWQELEGLNWIEKQIKGGDLFHRSYSSASKAQRQTDFVPHPALDSSPPLDDWGLADLISVGMPVTGC